MKLSIIIPVFNEEKTIERILNKVSAVSLPQVVKEIIVINDGSNDNTELQIKNYELQNKKQIIRVIRHKKNYGKGQAVRTGIKYATGEYILIQDADAEYDPTDIIRLLEPIQQKRTQIVYGTRLKRLPNFKNEEKSIQFFIHYIGNKILSFLTSILYGQWITDIETGYKIFPKRSVISMKLDAKGFEFEPEITAKFLKAGYKIKEVSIRTNPRGYSEGKKLNTMRDGLKALYAIIKYKFIS
ncbi:MAG TPA: glycosyltransferase family 2 protein [Candidatus Saccharimonadales bacterium]|nr:glycosyltransferase family 2 protein [Candidatus Saccharimonadales bacterium]